MGRTQLNNTVWVENQQKEDVLDKSLRIKIMKQLQKSQSGFMGSRSRAENLFYRKGSITQLSQNTLLGNRNFSTFEQKDKHPRQLRDESSLEKLFRTIEPKKKANKSQLGSTIGGL